MAGVGCASSICARRTVRRCSTAPASKSILTISASGVLDRQAELHSHAAAIGVELPHLGLVMLDRDHVGRFQRSSLAAEKTPPDLAPTDAGRHATAGDHKPTWAGWAPLGRRSSICRASACVDFRWSAAGHLECAWLPRLLAPVAILWLLLWVVRGCRRGCKIPAL